MNMLQELDYTTLKWVKDEIGESLKQTRQALEAYVENPDDKTQIRFCATYLHQIYGTLQMVEIYGGALLAEEMEMLTDAILGDRVTQKDDAYDVLMRAIIQLPSYLEHIEQGHNDQPVILLPLLNDLRAAHGDTLLSDNAFFSPNLSISPPSVTNKKEPKEPDIQKYIKKLRTAYQAALVRVYRNENPKANLKKIAGVLRELHNLSTNENASRLWWVASAVIEAIYEGGIEAHNSVKLLIGHIDREIKRIVETGKRALQEDPPADLVKNLLYYVALAKSSGHRVAQIKQAFSLEAVLPGAGEIDAAFDSLKGSSNELLKSVSTVIKEDLLQIKDQLDIFVRSSEQKPSQLEPLTEQLVRISDTLAMLGFGDLRKIIQDQVNNVKQLTASGDAPSEMSLMEIASALLFVESSLDGIESRELVSQGAEDTAGAETLLPAGEQKHLTKLVISEAAEVLARVKETLNTFANDTTKLDLLTEIPEYLGQVKGVLAVLAFDQASHLLQSAIEYIRDEVLDKRKNPNQAALDAIADVITSIEYYLEAVTESRRNPESILAVAIDSISKLGYPVEAIDQTTQPVEKKKLTPPPISVESLETASQDMTPAAPEPGKGKEVEKAQVDAVQPVDEPPPIEDVSSPQAQITEISPSDPTPVELDDDIDEEILEIFIEEADEVLVTMKDNLRDWQTNNGNKDALDVLRRSYHTIKGSGRLAGASTIGEFAWAIENMLNQIVDGKIEPNTVIFELLSKAETLLESLINQLKGQEGSIASTDIQTLSELADSVAKGETPSALPPSIVETNVEAGPESAGEASETLGAQEPEIELLPSDEAPANQSQEVTLTDIFRKETAVHLQSIRDFINGYNDSVPQFVSNPLRLALHTLHGSARMANVSEIAQISELLDRYFRTLYDTHQVISTDALSVLSDGAALISEMHQHFTEKGHQTPDTSDLQKRISILHQLADRTSLEEMESADGELVAIFVDEGMDILENISATLASRGDQNDIDTMESLQRSLHTLKGGARMAGIKPIAELAYRLESMFAAIAERKEALNYDLVIMANDCHAWFEKALNQIRENADPDSSEPLLNRINQFVGIESEPVESKIKITDAVDRLEPVSEDEDMIELELGDFSPEPEPDNELLSIFLNEAAEIQSVLEEELKEWRKNIEGLNPIGALQRSLHTLKGGARMANATAISDIAHALETLLEDIVEKRAIVSDQHIRLVQAGHDWFTAALDQARNNEPLETASALLTEIQAQSALAKAAKGQMTVEIDMTQTLALESVAEETAASPSDITEDGENPTIEINMSQVLVDTVNTVDIPDFATTDAQTTGTTESEPSDYDSELLGVFLEEAEEIQETCDQIIHRWTGDYANREYITELQRALHTLKGGARMANIKAIGNLSHAIESLLEAVTEGELQPTAAFPLAAQSGHDWITHSIQKVKNNEEIEEATDLLTQLEQLASGESVSFPEKLSEEPAEPVELVDLPTDDTVESQKPVRRIHHTAVRNRDEQIRIGADLIDTLVNNAGEINIYNARINQQFNDWHFNLAELNQTTQRLHEQLRKFEIETEAQIMYRHSSSEDDKSAASTTEDFDPLELDRFSYMQQLSRGLVESLGDLTSIQAMLESNSTDADVLLLQQSRINSDLQEGLMRTRLTPFSSVLARLRRIVRQTCKETGKEANLNVEGAEGEMDRTQLNRIVPALEHVVRNAIDHGIELPVKREKSGKNREGSINIHFSREGSEVVLQVSDDGAGIDLKALREKAIERGLIGTQSTINDSDLTEFILESGFSTATEVTQISGRGIGMDVVNNEIKQLNGSLVIHTEEGKGSTFTIRLPLTVLINNALLLHVDESIYAIQISNIEHVIRVTDDELGKLVSGEEGFYHYADHQYQHIHLGHVLHGTRPQAVSGKQRHPLLLGRSGDHRVAMQVDQLIGRQEIVVKSVGPQLSTVNNISGATILPDGEVALILDVGTLIRTNLALQQKVEETGEALYVARTAVEDKARPTSVMVVDDSITVRKVTERLLKRYSMDTCTAKDGVDALTQLLETIPDIMLLDIEMPRMDGYELAQAMKNDPRLKDIPIIMITSRSGEKHRERALSIGVNMYMGKPYQEHDLLNNIQSLLAES